MSRFFLDVHAGHRLVEQQHRRFGCQRARQLDTLLQAVRQAADRRLADMLDFEEVDHLLHLAAVRQFLAPGAANVDRLLDEACLHLRDAAGHHVVEHTHALNKAMFWKVRDALGCRLVRLHLAAALFAAKCNAALLRLIDAVDDVEHRALAGAVGADDGLISCSFTSKEMSVAP